MSERMAASGSANKTSTLRPYGLTCEQLVEPRGIDELVPRLSWKLASSRRGDAQSAYRIRVLVDSDSGQIPRGQSDKGLAESGRNSGNSQDPAPRWDSGRVESTTTLHIPYDGPTLAPSTTYRWRVDVWDVDGAPAGAAESWFETGLMDTGAWSAAWIGRDDTVSPAFDPPQNDDLTANTRRLQACSHLRRSFTLDRRPVRARLYSSTRGVYRAYLNGHRIGDSELDPGWTDYRDRILYQAYDVTALVKSGDNAIGAILGDGWWSGFVGFDPRLAGKLYGDSPALIAQLHLTFDDGSEERIVTDERWRESAGPLRYSDLLMGDYFDARARLDGWSEPGYDDAGWLPVAVVDHDTSRLRSQRLEPVRVTTELRPRAIWPEPDGTTMVDLGQNLVGKVRLTVRDAPRGTRIELRHAEMLTPEGDLYLENLRRVEATDVYVAGGAPVETYEPTFTFHGFRYVRIEGYLGTLTMDDITGLVMHSDLPWTGSFSCDDDQINQLAANISWGQRGNFLSVPTDCPQRDERLGWLADAQVFLPTAARSADVAAFFASWLEDVVFAQDDDGAFPDVAPKVCTLREGAPAWGDGGVIIPWTLYQLYGEVRILRRCFPAMVRWVEHIRRHNPDLLWRTRMGRNYGDWLQVGAETPRDVLATAYFAHSADLVARTARVLGETDQVDYHAALAADIRAAFVQEFVDSEGRIHGDTQTGYLLALEFGLLPTELEPAAARQLAANVEAHDHHLTTGFIGVSLLCPVLARIGRSDLAHALLAQDTFPSWLFSVRHGATTIWERWDGWTPEQGFQSPMMNSFNHYSLGAVGDWLYGGVAGIERAPDSVAYSALVIRPDPGPSLTSAGAEQETPRGLVASRWWRADNAFTLEVVVPPGVTATVHVPTQQPDAVSESGLPLGQAPGVRVLTRQKDHLVCAVPSGHYHFEAPF
ncbi:alpha-L-rhamnosidase [Actinopolymorpha alba]|uniref:alpha-L-rhamnosidase n=1 Tax=Actinopolymorpha alba TaxID=533267 RepID=UPI00146B4ACB|nr:alpha-L-rhamnosidase [Actinopolymorpha alba]